MADCNNSVQLSFGWIGGLFFYWVMNNMCHPVDDLVGSVGHGTLPGSSKDRAKGESQKATSCVMHRLLINRLWLGDSVLCYTYEIAIGFANMRSSDWLRDVESYSILSGPQTDISELWKYLIDADGEHFWHDTIYDRSVRCKKHAWQVCVLCWNH